MWDPKLLLIAKLDAETSGLQKGQGKVLKGQGNTQDYAEIQVTCGNTGKHGETSCEHLLRMPRISEFKCV